MAVERTLSIIKPDAVAKNVIGEIYSRFERAGLRIVAAKMTWLARPDAEGFYAVHRGRPFFADLVDFMISGPVMIQVLEGESAIARNRDLAKGSREALAHDAEIRAPAVVRDTVSGDGTRKWLLDVGGANAIEAVYIPEGARDDWRSDSDIDPTPQGAANVSNAVASIP